jgi:hypothetical protein
MVPAKPHRRLQLRIVLAVVACLVMGCVTSAGVAWGLSLRDGPAYGCMASLSIDTSQQGKLADIQFINFNGEYRAGFARVSLSAILGPPRGFDRAIAARAIGMLEEQMKNQNGPAELNGKPEPFWPPSIELPPDDGSRYASWAVRAAGWPCLCMCSRINIDSSSRRSMVGLLSILGSSQYISLRSSDPEQGTIPLIPMWRGLAANTAFFAAAWAVLLVLFPAVYRRHRASRRRRLGLCAACAYDLKAQDGPCPECGVVRQSNNMACS